jgi:hypothetical protein
VKGFASALVTPFSVQVSGLKKPLRTSGIVLLAGLFIIIILYAAGIRPQAVNRLFGSEVVQGTASAGPVGGDVNDLESKIDQKIGGLTKEAGKGLIIAVSKWDSLEKDSFTIDTVAARIRQEFEFVPWAPLIFTSSKEDQNITKIFELATEIAEVRTTKIATSKLNSWLEHQIHRHPPAGLKNRHPKLNYITQITDEKTPTFKLFGAHTKLLHWSYKRYLEKELRNEFGFAGTAINMTYLEKHVDRKKADPYSWKNRLRPEQVPNFKIKKESK